jgi:hypothetical protein
MGVVSSLRSRGALVGAGLILVAGLIHLFLTPEHFREAPYLGLLFVADFAGSAVAAFGIYRRHRWGWMLGALVAIGAFVSYIVAGTVGFPSVERGHFLEPIGVFTKTVEVLFLMLCVHQFMSFRQWILVSSIAAVLVMTGTATALGLQGTHAGHHGHDHQVSAAEQEAAAKLVGDTEAGTARFEDFEAAQAEGYEQMTGKGGRYRPLFLPAHFINKGYVEDGRVLDPERPEGLMYMKTLDGGMKLVGVMYVAPRGEGPTDDRALTQWHTHIRLCIDYDEDTGVVVSLKRLGGCSEGSSPVSELEMMHVWLFDHPDGPLAPHLKPKDVLAMRSAEL